MYRLEQAMDVGEGAGREERTVLTSMRSEVSRLHQQMDQLVHGAPAQGVSVLEMTDLSPHFRLTLNDAARELGVSPTTLKSEYKRLGPRRWPHRELTGLDSTVHTLELTRAVGEEEASRQQLTMAYVNSEALRIRNGTPEQVTRTMGVGYPLELTDLFPHFDLTLVHAARKLRISQTTLKKECRRLGIRRWPGHNVRSLHSRIWEVQDAFEGEGSGEVYDPSGPSASAACWKRQGLGSSMCVHCFD